MIIVLLSSAHVDNRTFSIKYQRFGYGLNIEYNLCLFLYAYCYGFGKFNRFLCSLPRVSFVL